MNKKLFLVILMLSGLLITFYGCGKSESYWNDGEYEGTAEGLHGEIGVKVVVEKGEISKIDILSQNETEGLSDVALEQIPKNIIDKQSTDVDTVSGATESSNAIIAAVENALSSAEK
ncbi:MAG: hypothetical protein K0R92_3463 [Lachnospiraceae bacterium]|jgi:uncharacterized protein with FMN-binding domain|nr:hypothetical protein [Lachnospiraceae bacterium]